MSPEELLNLERDRRETNWKFIADAIEHYKSRGYTYTEVPWIISDEAVRITWQGPITYSTPVGNLVGSAEQSLLDMELNSLVPDVDKLVTCSPCWRDEGEYDEWHQTSFMKVELYSRENRWNEFLDDALNLFVHRIGFGSGSNIEIVKCPNGPYIEQHDICVRLHTGELVELGSYGCRKEGKLEWSYGTGLAEPRTSQTREKALEKFN